MASPKMPIRFESLLVQDERSDEKPYEALMTTIPRLHTSTFTAKLHPSSVTKAARRFTYALTPQIFRSRYLKEQQAPERALSDTAYLDGLRGLAALAVFNFHFFFAFTDYTHIGWGYQSSHYSIIALPVFRLLYDGGTCVNVFFVVAGYVCSAKALQLMTAGEHEKVLRSLWGSVFRRALRLYLPVLTITFITTVMSYLGFFEGLRPMLTQRKKHFAGAFGDGPVPRQESLTGQLYVWIEEMWSLANVWNSGPFYPEHDKHLWTIAYEFRTSMHLYLALLGTSMCRPVARLCFLITLAFVYLLWNRWEGPLFFLGAAIAQWEIIRKAKSFKSLPLVPVQRDASGRRFNSAQLLRLLGYGLALYLMSFPIANFKSPAPGFAFVNKLIPRWYSRKEKFPKSVGMLVLLYLLSTNKDQENSLWHRAMRSNVAQYMGRYMFALYLVHGPMLRWFGYGIPFAVWTVTGKDTNLGWVTGLFLGWAISLTSCLLVAEVFTREVDVRLAAVIRKWEKMVL